MITKGLSVFAVAAAGMIVTCAWAGEAPRITATGEGAAVLGYLVSRHSPLVSPADRTAISQDFNGAPLDGKPRTHVVTARSVDCRARAPGFGRAAPRCAIDFGLARLVEFQGPDSLRLYSALGKVGAEDDGGMGHIERRIVDLTCVVNDAEAQGTPATGDDVAGFSCAFHADD